MLLGRVHLFRHLVGWICKISRQRKKLNLTFHMKIGTSDVIRWLHKARLIMFLQLCSSWYLPSSYGVVKCPALTFLLCPKLSLEIYGKKWSRKIKVAQMLVFIRLNPIPPSLPPSKIALKVNSRLVVFQIVLHLQFWGFAIYATIWDYRILCVPRGFLHSTAKN